MKDSIYANTKWLDRFISKSPDRFNDRERLNYILNTLPAGVSRILDVGVGGGYIYKALKERGSFDCYGVDISLPLVKRLGDGRVCVADLKGLPFKDREFDMVIAADLLEHVKEEYLEKSINELTRVSNRFVLVNSPYKDAFFWPVALCDRCGREFNIYGHLRSIDDAFLKKVFPESRFKFIKVATFGQRRKLRPRPLAWIARKLARLYSGDPALCPYCFNDSVKPPERGRMRLFLSGIISGILGAMDRLTPFFLRPRCEIGALLEKRKAG